MIYHPGNDPKYHPENLLPIDDSPLTGKRLLFLGSSVTNGSAALDISMADYIRNLDSCEVIKEAVNGTTLANRNADSYLSRLKHIGTSQTFDAVVCQLSTNDASQKMILGSISDSKDINSFNTSTTVGAMEAIIAYIQTAWNCPVVFYTGTKYNSPEYQAMVNVLPLLQKKWGIGIIDLWNDVEMNSVTRDDYSLYMNDHVHPTQAGYLLWWTPKFQTFLYNLFAIE